MTKEPPCYFFGGDIPYKNVMAVVNGIARPVVDGGAGWGNPEEPDWYFAIPRSALPADGHVVFCLYNDDGDKIGFRVVKAGETGKPQEIEDFSSVDSAGNTDGTIINGINFQQRNEETIRNGFYKSQRHKMRAELELILMSAGVSRERIDRLLPELR